VAVDQGCRLLLLRQPPPAKAGFKALRMGTQDELVRLLAAWSAEHPE
jgi:hypothetical protein